MSLFYLCCFSLLAGFIDSLVGGGGLLQLPAFFILFPNLGLAETLAANKFASFLGTVVSAVRYVKNIKIEWRFITPALFFAFIGSVSGAMLVSTIRKEQFMPFILAALLIVLSYTLVKKQFGLHHKPQRQSIRKVLLLSSLIGGTIGLYDGLISPGAGSFLIFSYVIVFGHNFLQAGAASKIINTVTGFAALSFFLFNGNIIWSIALPAAAANMLGNYIGSHVALKKGSGFIRIVFLVVAVLLFLKLAYDYLIK